MVPPGAGFPAARTAGGSQNTPWLGTAQSQRVGFGVLAPDLQSCCLQPSPQTFGEVAPSWALRCHQLLLLPAPHTKANSSTWPPKAAGGASCGSTGIPTGLSFSRGNPRSAKGRWISRKSFRNTKRKPPANSWIFNHFNVITAFDHSLRKKKKSHTNFLCLGFESIYTVFVDWRLFKLRPSDHQVVFLSERQDRKCCKYWCKTGMLLLELKLRHLIYSKENRIVHAHTHTRI